MIYEIIKYIKLEYHATNIHKPMQYNIALLEEHGYNIKKENDSYTVIFQ